MNKYKNPYIRLQTYYSWLVNDEDNMPLLEDYILGIPIKKLSELTEIPLKVIRKDIIIMLQWQARLWNATRNQNIKMHNLLEFDIESTAYKSVCKREEVDQYIDDLTDGLFSPELENLILTGDMDNVPIHCYDNEKANYITIPISTEETEALDNYINQNVQREKNKEAYQRKYYIKDSYRYIHKYSNLQNDLDKINQAITDNRCLQFRYWVKEKGSIKLEAKPLMLSYDATDNLYSVIISHNEKIKTIRLDTLIDISESKTKMDTTSQKQHLLEIAPHVWGNDFAATPINVKIKFYNEARVWQKVKKEFENRDSKCLYEKNGYLFCEDKIYGIEKFKKWLSGFGSSAIIIEPKSMQREMIESLKRRLSN